MREIKFDEIERIWEKNTAPTMLYVHSAFCKSICKYCVYRGCLKDKNFDKYFNDYLPSQIEKYLPIINNQNITEIYFGGGTPNIVPDLSNLEPAFEKIRHIKAREKVIELHFNIPITEKTISKVIEEGFTTVILCIQTFNRNLLARQNRVNERCNDIEEIISKFHDAGLYVAADFIYFPDDVEGFESLQRDLRTLARLNNKFDEITFSTCYQNKTNKEHAIAKDLEEALEKSKFDFCVLPVSHDANLKSSDNASEKAYIKEWESLFDPPFSSFQEYIRAYNGARLFRAESLVKGDFFKFPPYLDETHHELTYEINSSYFEKETSVIGVGSYKNADKSTYSRCGEYSYHEAWDGDTTRYYLTCERTFYQKAHEFLNWMENVSDGREPEIGTELTFRNFGHIRSHTENAYDCILDYELSAPYKSEYIENINKHENELKNFYE